MTEKVIILDGVWKIFGYRAEEAMQAVKDEGMSKPEVLEKFGCVIGIVDCSFEVSRGEIFCVMGLSGSGKSTMVRHLNGLIEPTAGNIQVLGHDVFALSEEKLRNLRAAHIGMVFQHMALFPHRTVRDNVAFPLQVQGESKSKRWAESQRCLNLVNLEGYEDRFPSELSGGMQQRVGLARALASNPEVLLMDEPFSALDPLIRRQLQEQFMALSAELNKTTVFITHDLDEAIRIGNRIAIMKDGVIVQIGTPEEIVTNPIDEYVTDFVEGISTLNLIFAHTIMEKYDEYQVTLHEDLSKSPRVPHDTDLSGLIDISTTTDQPIVITDDNNDVGVVNKIKLLKSIKGGGGIMQESGFPAGPSNLTSSVSDFVVENSEYYSREFEKIQSATGFPKSWNTMAFVAGPFWGAARGLWGYFWTFMVLEIFTLVQIGKGLWGELGAAQLARIEKIAPKIETFMAKYDAALAAGADNAATFLTRAENLQKVADRLAQEVAALDATSYLIFGILLFVALRFLQGFYANMRYEKQYLIWRAEHDNSMIGVKWSRIFFGIVLWMVIAPLTLYRFTVGKIAPELEAYTLGFPVEKKTYFSPIANWMEEGFDWLTIHGSGVFDSVVASIRSVLDGLEIIFVGTPWPVVMTVIVVMAWRLAGPRIAIFTVASLAYLGFLGMWETSMITVSLLGAAAFLCLCLGIPLGIWFGKSQRAYNAVLPVLDFMQTMPAFVYLIPIIAFFGTGKPPGVLATIIFGMPPVIRLTALGMRGVPETTKEAALAFGCTKWTLLKDVELPLAMPSIMTGINQTILMCLSMVVIASLIGAKGLGQDVLIALQYAAKGQGVLAGLAILLCAMVIDRIIQGHYKKKTQRYKR